MAIRFFIKRLPKTLTVTQEIVINKPKEVKEEKNTNKSTKNKKNKKEEDMNFEDRINAAEATLEQLAPEVKVVKKEKGLIERTESSKIIITEDNRQLLKD